MKTKLLIIVLLLAGQFACISQKNLQQDAENGQDLVLKETESETDEKEHVLIIFDHGFNTWFSTHARPASFYDLQYLENWNQQLVMQWNSATSGGRHGACRPGQTIHFDPRENYGMEINHKLFYYFRYVHERCGLFRNRPSMWR